MSKLNLMVHCGGHEADRGQIARAITPQAQDDWVPIPHIDLLYQVTESLESTGLKVINEAHALSREGQRYFGMMEIADNFGRDHEYSTVIGVRNSHDKSFAAGLVVGSGVFVCDNLAFSGEIKLARKHTTHIMRDLPALTQVAVGRLNRARINQDKRIEVYKNHELSRTEADHLIMEMLRSQVFTPSQTLRISKEYKDPRHAEHREYKGTAWCLFNAVTEFNKGNLGAAVRRGQALHGVMDSACGLTFPDLMTDLKKQRVEIKDVLVA